MIKFPAVRFMVVSMIMWAAGQGIAHAQDTTALDRIRTAISHSIGAPDAAVEATFANNVLRVARINSPMNATSHEARNAESIEIAAAAAKAIKGDPAYAGLVSIRVEYIQRTGAGGHDIKLDSIEFRENPQGLFEFHRT